MYVIWYTAMSMDGRLAGPDDDLSFLETISSDGEDGDFERVLDGVDAIVVGSGTMRWLHARGHDLPSIDMGAVWLVSHDQDLAARMAAAATESTPVVHVSGDIADVFRQMEAAGYRR